MPMKADFVFTLKNKLTSSIPPAEKENVTYICLDL